MIFKYNVDTNKKEYWTLRDWDTSSILLHGLQRIHFQKEHHFKGHAVSSSTMVFNVAKIASARASLTISLTKSLRVAGPLVMCSLFTITKNYLLPAKRKVSYQTYMSGKLSMSVLHWICIRTAFIASAVECNTYSVTFS